MRKSRGQYAQNGQTAPKGGAQAAVGAQKNGLRWPRIHANGCAAATMGIFSTVCYMGYPDKEIAAPSGMGIKILLRDLVGYLRENGVDDEGGWDCDATEDIEIKHPPALSPFKLVVEAYATDEYGEGPSWAEVTVTPGFLQTLERLRRVCQDENLESVTVPQGPDLWDLEDDLRIRGDSLRVWRDDFWFDAHPKHMQLLGWKAQRDLAAMCQDHWCWQKHNPQGYL